ncbi:MAG: transposase family protein [Chloroflexi bacterium]|nr:transposase family protein [Chloroflexota bacterium]
MSQNSKQEYFRIMHARYHRARSDAEKSQLLDEFCEVCSCHRKHAIRKLNRPLPTRKKKSRRKARGTTYNAKVIGVLKAVWEAAGYPWSVRLKALLPLWLVWIRIRYALTSEQERQLLAISARQIDRRLQSHKLELKRRLYGRTKPGTLLKHQIPIRTEHWDVTEPGYVEIDLVSHSGSHAEGDFIYSLNLTDIFTGWTETRAVMGKGQRGVVAALDEMKAALPFALKAIDSDNGSEFLNAHLVRYCKQQHLEFTRSRPYKKDDNAHIEQKNWTHVRKLIGYDRFDSLRALAAMNDLYTGEWPLMMNLFQPSVKLQSKVRKGSRLTRRYDTPQTPLDRLLQAKCGDPQKIAALLKQRQLTDPFDLAATIERKVENIWALANLKQAPRVSRKRG